MSITVLLFGSAKSIVGNSEVQFNLDQENIDNNDNVITPKKLKELLTTSKTILDLIGKGDSSATIKEWRDIIETAALAVNQEYIENNWENDEMKLTNKMEIALIPTVSGG